MGAKPRVEPQPERYLVRVSPKTPNVLNGDQITLGKATNNLDSGTIPAFTINTTVAESGGRFLLSNYMGPPAVKTDPRNTEFLPAKSFLQTYAQESCCAYGPPGERLYADLPLPTTTRMSATFPVVPSATRDLDPSTQQGHKDP